LISATDFTKKLHFMYTKCNFDCECCIFCNFQTAKVSFFVIFKVENKSLLQKMTHNFKLNSSLKQIFFTEMRYYKKFYYFCGQNFNI
jgi:hypothetical protein